MKTGEITSQGQQSVLGTTNRIPNNLESLLGDAKGTKPSNLSDTKTTLQLPLPLHVKDKMLGKAEESDRDTDPANLGCSSHTHTASKLKSSPKVTAHKGVVLVTPDCCNLALTPHCRAL